MPSFEAVAELVARIPDGAKLAVVNDGSGVAMRATFELVRARRRGLHLVTLPVAGLQADILIGAGCVDTLESSAVTLGEYGAAPAFTRAVRSGALRMRDATCPAIYAGLQAAQKGIPFMPLRGILETDLLRFRDDWRVIDNPFQAGDRIVVLPAIRPDVALLHVPVADRLGNLFVGRQRDLLLLAHASAVTVATAEVIVEGNLLEDEARAGSVVPSLYVDALAHVPRGAWPLGFGDAYAADSAWLARYAREAVVPEGFRRMLDEALDATATHA